MIRVGGATEDRGEGKRDRVEDAMNATRAAVEEGIVAGGGAALLLRHKALEKVVPANDDQRVGVEIVRRAIQDPGRQIAENAGVDGSIVVGKLLEGEGMTFGYDAQTDNSRPGQGRCHRSGQGGTYRASGCGVRCWPPDYHRSHGRGKALQRWRHGRHARHGRYGRYGRYDVSWPLPTQQKRKIKAPLRRGLFHLPLQRRSWISILVR